MKRQAKKRYEATIKISWLLSEKKEHLIRSEWNFYWRKNLEVSKLFRLLIYGLARTKRREINISYPICLHIVCTKREEEMFKLVNVIINKAPRIPKVNWEWFSLDRSASLCTHIFRLPCVCSQDSLLRAITMLVSLSKKINQWNMV